MSTTVLSRLLSFRRFVVSLSILVLVLLVMSGMPDSFAQNRQHRKPLPAEEAMERYDDPPAGFWGTGTSPGRISWTPSRVATRPMPSVTYRVWPLGWWCQAVRAPGVNRTWAHPTADCSSGVRTPSMKTAPVNLGCTNDLGQVLLISRGCVHARTSSSVQSAVQG